MNSAADWVGGATGPEKHLDQAAIEVAKIAVTREKIAAKGCTRVNGEIDDPPCGLPPRSYVAVGKPQPTLEQIVRALRKENRRLRQVIDEMIRRVRAGEPVLGPCLALVPGIVELESGEFVAFAKIAGKTVGLGRFATREEAEAARLASDAKQAALRASGPNNNLYGRAR
jgi:hypothetical protein